MAGGKKRQKIPKTPLTPAHHAKGSHAPGFGTPQLWGQRVAPKTKWQWDRGVGAVGQPGLTWHCEQDRQKRLTWQPMRRKEIAAVNYYFAIIKLLALTWLIFTLIYMLFVLNTERVRVSGKGRVKYFFGFS